MTDQLEVNAIHLMIKAMAAAAILRQLFADCGRIETATVSGRPVIVCFPEQYTVSVQPGDVLRFYLDCMPADASAEEIADMIGVELAAMLTPGVGELKHAVDHVTGRENILDRVIVRAVNESQYPELMDCRLNIRTHGMTFAYFLNCSAGELACCNAAYLEPLDPQAAAEAGVSGEELREAALKNLQWFFGEKIYYGVQPEMSADGLIECARTPGCIRGFGASVLLYPELLAEAGEKLQEDFYVVPSSTHCLALIGAEERNSSTDQQIREKHAGFSRIQKEVCPEEFLSSSVFFYSRRTGELTEV